jgi:DNA-binding response OmpR family regulator
MADDLIWATRLADLVRGAGATALPARSAADLGRLLPDADRVIVDLTARGYDGIVAIAAAVAAGLPVLAIGQHDDLEARRRALAAGAGRMLAYRRMFEDGPGLIAAWLAVPRAVESAP